MALILELQGNRSVRIVEKAWACNRAHTIAVICDLEAFVCVCVCVCGVTPKLGANLNLNVLCLLSELKCEWHHLKGTVAKKAEMIEKFCYMWSLKRTSDGKLINYSGSVTKGHPQHRVTELRKKTHDDGKQNFVLSRNNKS